MPLKVAPARRSRSKPEATTCALDRSTPWAWALTTRNQMVVTDTRLPGNSGPVHPDAHVVATKLTSTRFVFTKLVQVALPPPRVAPEKLGGTWNVSDVNVAPRRSVPNTVLLAVTWLKVAKGSEAPAKEEPLRSAPLKS